MKRLAAMVKLEKVAPRKRPAEQPAEAEPAEAEPGEAGAAEPEKAPNRKLAEQEPAKAAPANGSRPEKALAKQDAKAKAKHLPAPSKKQWQNGFA